MKNDPLLQILWEDYKKQVWWKKVILFLPFIFLAIILIALYFSVKNDKVIEMINNINGKADQKVDEKIEDSIDASKEVIKKSEKKVKKLEKEQQEAIKENKKDEKAISDAGTDFDKLNRIAEELRARNAARKR
jgi:septal ring factor EnvC (AmiA/AmiB activator)